MSTKASAILALLVLLAGVILIGRPTPSLAQLPDRMERPVWKPGDRWVQALRNSVRGSGREVSTVRRVDDFEGVQAYFVEFDITWTDSQGRQRNERFTQIRDLNLTPIAFLAGDRVVARLKWDLLKWPLIVGETWTIEGVNEFLTPGGWVRRRISGLVAVKGVEEVATPAGRFAAFHVQTVRRQLNEQGQQVASDVEDAWFSPQARNAVKFTYRTSTSSEEGELVEYPP